MSAQPATVQVPPSNSREMLRAYAILFAGIFAFSFSAIFVRAAQAPGFVVATWRVAIASLILSGPFLRQPAAERRLSPGLRRPVLIGAVTFAASLGTFHIALDHTTAANATFIGSIAPVWVGLFTLVILHQVLPPLFWRGVGLSMVGVGFIVFGGGSLTDIHSGDLLVFINSTVWATYQVITARARARMSAITWVWWVVTFAAMGMFPAALLFGYRLTGYDTASGLAILGAGVVSQSGGFMAYNYALGRISAARASVSGTVQPVITTILAAILLGEEFGGLRLVGGALVILGVYLTTRRHGFGKAKAKPKGADNPRPAA
jgi:drug/metabolite transporter (DMT)-like permease